jgi:hypothetical protein
MEDSLVHSVLHKPGSAVHVALRNLGQLTLADNRANARPHTAYAHNTTYSLTVASADSVHLAAAAFQRLQIAPYSSFSAALRSVRQARLAPTSFAHLQLGDFARFSLLVEAADSVRLGADLFAFLSQAAGSHFSVQVDKCGVSGADDYGDYYEGEEYPVAEREQRCKFDKYLLLKSSLRIRIC